MTDALTIIRRRLRHPDFHAALDRLGDEAELRAHLGLCDLDCLTVQTDMEDEIIGREIEHATYLKWQRVGDVVATLNQHTKESA